MSKSKKRIFTADMVGFMMADIKMALTGVAMKYNVNLAIDDKVVVDQKSIEVFMPIKASIIPQTDEQVSDRIAVMIAALPNAHIKHFPKLPLTAIYRNGDHSYNILGFNNKAREHKLLMKNIETDELFRFSIEQVSEFKIIKQKRSKK